MTARIIHFAVPNETMYEEKHVNLILSLDKYRGNH